MSKTLFNTNTFNNKNVKNSDDVADLKVTTFKATNAILTNITNTELQAATTGVSNNATAIAGKQDTLTFNAPSSNNSNPSTSAQILTELNTKQPTLTEGTGIAISGSNEISFDGSIGSTSISTSGDVTAGNLIYIDNDSGLAVLTNVKTKIDANTSAISGKQDTLTFNAPSSNNSNPSTSAQILTALNLKQDTLTFNAPSSNNSNPSTSAQILTALNAKQDTLTSSSDIDVDDITLYGYIRTSTTSSDDFYIFARDVLEGSGVHDELILAPSITDGSTVSDGKLHLGGYRDEDRNTHFETSRNNYYATSHHFYSDHTQRYAFYQAYLNLINQDNDSSIDLINLPDLETDYTHFVDGIRIGFTGQPSSSVGEGRGHYIGILNKNESGNSSGLIAFGKDGGGSPDPNIGIAFNPSTGNIYSGGDMYLAGEFRGGGRRGGRIIYGGNFDRNNAKGGTSGDGTYGGNASGSPAYLAGFSRTITIGTVTLCKIDDPVAGKLKVNLAGTYKITVKCSAENANYANRACVGLYLSINGDETVWRNAQRSGSFGMMYLRDDDFGYSGNCYFSDYYVLAVDDVLCINTKLGLATDSLAWNDTTDDANINIYCNIEIEMISSNTVLASS